MPSFAERLIEQGRIKGEQEAKRKGYIRGMQDILIICIRHKFSISPQCQRRLEFDPSVPV